MSGHMDFTVRKQSDWCWTKLALSLLFSQGWSLQDESFILSHPSLETPSQMCAEVCLLGDSGKDAEGLLVTVLPQRCCLQTWSSLVLTCPRLCVSKGTKKELELL